MKSNRLIKRLDWYIIKKFLGTYVFAIALIISIAVVFDFNEKMDKLMEHEAPWDKIIFEYYMNFIPYFSNLFSPLFVFIAVIFFTSKLAENSEIIAMFSIQQHSGCQRRALHRARVRRAVLCGAEAHESLRCGHGARRRGGVDESLRSGQA